MNLYAFFAVVNFFTSLILGIFVFASNRKDKINLSFSLFASAVAFWSFGYYFWQVSTSAETALFWCRLLMAGAVFIPFTYLCFVFRFLEIFEQKKRFLLFTFLLFLIFFFLDFTPLFISHVEPILGFKFWPIAGPFYTVFLVFWFFYVIYSTYLLYKKYQIAKGIVRFQIAYVSLGMIIGFLGGATNYFLWYRVPIPPFANILVSVYVAMVAYAIVKHHLMDVKVIATEMFAVFLTLLTLIDVFRAGNMMEMVGRLVLFFLTLFFSTLLISSILNEVRRREEMEQLTMQLQKIAKQLKTANKDLQRLDDAKSEFLSIASHQLRTPLTIIKGYISMMLEGNFGRVPKLLKTNLEKVSTAGERLLSLVESLLDISRIEAGRLEFDLKPTDLSEIVKSLAQDFQTKAGEKKVKLTFYNEGKIPSVTADAQKAKEVISNLIDNSVKYTPEGEIMLGLHQEGQSVVFSCQDTGMGIEPDDLPRLFNKFVRGKGMMQVHTEGTGLGLYFARVVIENMGGRIWAESPGKGQGSKFCFSLPLADKGRARKVK